MPTSVSTRLDAINLMLSAIGLAPVASLTGEGDAETLFAEQQLDATSREVQSAGWWFNTSKQTYAPIASGEIPIPKTVMYVDARPGSSSSRFTTRGGFLYNVIEGSSTFTSAVTLTVTEALPFDTIPEVARGYIIAKASRRFADRQLGDPALSRFSRDDEAQAYLTLRKAHMRAGNYTIWGPSIGASLRRGGLLNP